MRQQDQAMEGDAARPASRPMVVPRARALVWRIPLLYVLLGICWILFSDQLTAALFDDAAAITR